MWEQFKTFKFVTLKAVFFLLILKESKIFQGLLKVLWTSGTELLVPKGFVNRLWGKEKGFIQPAALAVGLLMHGKLGIGPASWKLYLSAQNSLGSDIWQKCLQFASAWVWWPFLCFSSKCGNLKSRKEQWTGVQKTRGLVACFHSMELCGHGQPSFQGVCFNICQIKKLN